MAKGRKKRKNSASVAGGTTGVIPGDELFDLLSFIVVELFEADPPIVPPFAKSVIRWKVAEVPPQVALRLNGIPAGHAGSRVFEPATTETYRLTAHAGSESRVLDTLIVPVAQGACVTKESSLVDEFLGGALRGGIEQSDNVYFRLVPDPGSLGQTFAPSKPEVTIAPGRISFRLKLKGRAPHFPDPDIDVDASFGLEIVPDESNVTAAAFIPHTKLAPVNMDVRVDVSFPWEAYLIPVAAIVIPILESMIEDSTRNRFMQAIRDFVASPALLRNWPAPADLVKHDVRIFLDQDGVGTVEIQFCPPPINADPDFE